MILQVSHFSAQECDDVSGGNPTRRHQALARCAPEGEGLLSFLGWFSARRDGQ
jgi:hypothetical protein